VTPQDSFSAGLDRLAALLDEVHAGEHDDDLQPMMLSRATERPQIPALPTPDPGDDVRRLVAIWSEGEQIVSRLAEVYGVHTGASEERRARLAELEREKLERG